MRTNAEELSLFARIETDANKDEKKGLRDACLKPAEGLPSPGELPRYASAFWLSNYESEIGLLRLTIGWAMRLEGSAAHESGGWTLRSRVPPRPTHFKGVLAPVEETHGIVFRKPDQHEEEINTHADRLLADWLLFLMHRVLFDQCKTLDTRIPDSVADIFLLFGPILPKFVGRVCYSNFTREKTVAVLAPFVRIGEIPEQSSQAWKAEPIPDFGHDHAERRWTTRTGNLGNDKNQSVPRVSSFTVIEPTGDGISGRIVSASKRGPAKWLEKSFVVHEIIDRDSVEIRMALWQHRSVRIPRGLAYAVRAAVLQHDIDYCSMHADRLKVRFKSESKGLFSTYEQRISKDVRGVRGPLCQKALLARARWRYAELLAGQDERQRAIVNRPEGITISQIRKEMTKSLGESVFTDFF